MLQAAVLACSPYCAVLKASSSDTLAASLHDSTARTTSKQANLNWPHHLTNRKDGENISMDTEVQDSTIDVLVQSILQRFPFGVLAILHWSRSFFSQVTLKHSRGLPGRKAKTILQVSCQDS